MPVLDLTDLQRAAESKYGLPPGLLTAVMRAESGGNPQARSSAGALGLYQFMPGTAEQLGIDPFDPTQATEGAGRYLGQLLRQTGSLDKALAAYNWGIGNVQRKGLEAAPEETRKYVPKVLGYLSGGASSRTLAGGDREDKLAAEMTHYAPEREPVRALDVGLGLLGSDRETFAKRREDFRKIGNALVSDPVGLLRSLADFPDYRGMSAETEPDPAKLNEWLGNLMGVGAIPGGMLGILAGPKGAARAGKGLLNEAEVMAARGLSDEEIWMKTGWWIRTPDDIPRWEIPDLNAALTGKADYGGPLSGGLKHPELARAYPEVASTYYERNFGPGVAQSGEFVQGAPYPMRVFSPTREGARSSTLHETTHAVQADEGMARGGSPGASASELKAEAESLWNQAETMFNNARDKRKVAPKVASMMHRARYLNDLAHQDAIGADDAYRLLAGEAEARAVQARADKPLGWLQRHGPWESYDEPLKDLIVKRR